jgi:hypothetical protein
MIDALFSAFEEKEKNKERKKRENWSEGFSQGRHILVAIPCWDFPSY